MSFTEAIRALVQEKAQELGDLNLAKHLAVEAIKLMEEEDLPNQDTKDDE